jgi:hypothetical protein
VTRTVTAAVNLRLAATLNKGFAEYGLLSVAYVKRICAEPEVYGAYAADGSYLWHYDNAEVARAALRQQEIEPLSVH